MEKKPRNLRLVIPSESSDYQPVTEYALEKKRDLGRFIKKIIGIKPVREAPVTPWLEHVRELRREEERWRTGRS